MLTEPREALPRSSTFVFTAAQGMDLTTTFEGKAEHLHTLAIWRLEGDVLTYCVAEPGRPRPTEFATSKGDGRTLVVLKRLAPG